MIFNNTSKKWEYSNGTNTYSLATMYMGDVPPTTGATDVGLLNYRPSLGRIVFRGNLTFIEYDGVTAGTARSGLFANKPTVESNFIYVGFMYFCVDKSTTEGSVNGIPIFHKGNNVWVDSLGRIVS